MAFNFNWSPLIADTARVKEMLTTALNKSPKPPIIVDDILVNELNLGSSPPELEILEIGDLAEDRFRGIFKMSYTGDAFLTLKTRVQANPLNTYLSTKPSFASPTPLAAASGLTIPLQITLSDIRLSGFVVLVFCRQKGITLVFRNDPLESLKVSSTFDSIPFVRNYLQKEIEAQLRILFMDDLPAIIHRLSLRHLVSGYREAEEHEERERLARLESTPVDPLGDSLSSLNLGTDPAELHATFSQKNMFRLAALADSQRTLALFTCPVRDAVGRAWTGNSDRRESVFPSLATGHLQPPSRIHSVVGSPTGGWSSAASEVSDSTSFSGRPMSMSHGSSASIYSMPNHRGKGFGTKRRRHRVVNLRRHSHDGSDGISVTTDVTGRHSAPDHVQWQSATNSPHLPPERSQDDEVDTPPRPPLRVHRTRDEHVRSPTAETHDGFLGTGSSSPRRRQISRETIPEASDSEFTPRANRRASRHDRPQRPSWPQHQQAQQYHSRQYTSHQHPPAFRQVFSSQEKPRPGLPRALSITDLGPSLGGFNGSILEQAWIAKIQADHLARMQRQTDTATIGGTPRNGRLEDDLGPPPAYVV